MFTDDVISELLPNLFEELGLYYSDPFSHCQLGDVESTWIMLVHGLDPNIVNQVRLNHLNLPN